ncbi:S8 family serine peptidase [Candidatus Woesearchaeota archaeon]|nr:S8 family serine peptidase [Candidatus Woesearchaeota archaeon]
MFGKKGVHGGIHGSSAWDHRHNAVAVYSRLSFMILAVIVLLGVVGFAVFNIYTLNFGAVGKAYSVVVLDEGSFKTGAVLSAEASVPRQLRLVVNSPVSAATASISGTASGIVLGIGPETVYERSGSLPGQPEGIGDFSYEIGRQCSAYPCNVEFTVVSASAGTVVLSEFSLVPAVAEPGVLGVSVETDKNYYNIGDSVMLVGARQEGSKPVSLIDNPKPEEVFGKLTIKIQKKSASPEPEWEDVGGSTVIDAKDVSVPASGFLDLSAELGTAAVFTASEPGRFRVKAELIMPGGSILADVSEFSVRALDEKKPCTTNFDCPVYYSCKDGFCTSFCGGGEAYPTQQQSEQRQKASEASKANIAMLKALGFEVEQGKSSSGVDLSGYRITSEGSAVVISQGKSTRKISGTAGSFVLADSNGNKVTVKRAALQHRKVASHIIELKSEPLLKHKASVEGELVAASVSAGGAAKVGSYAKESVNDLVKKSVDAYRKKLADAKAQALLEMQQANPNLPKSIVKEYSKAFSGFAANLSDEEVAVVRKLPSVKAVYPNGKVFALLDNSVNQISADEVWKLKDKTETVLTGKGITIAVIDTGVDYTHPDLGGCFGSGCKVADGYDFYNNDPDPMDDAGHGTHVAATAAGSGVLKGVAPDADIYAYKVLDSEGYGSMEDIIAAIERSVDPNDDNDFSDHADVISMSLGGRGNPDDPMSQAVDNAVSNGVVAVVAAGNDGEYGSNTIGSPGTARKAITVGAVDKCDNLASFSSRGPVIWDGGMLLKPDVVAPGVDICAAGRFFIDEGEDIAEQLRCLDNEHIAISGTSMATPHVSGAAALLLQAHPEWEPEDVKSALMLTAHGLGISPTEQGAGRIDVLRALSPAVAVSPQSISFEITEGTTYSTDVEVTNLLGNETTFGFDAVTFDEEGKVYEFAKVEPETLTLAPEGNGKVKLLVDVQPGTEGYFVGTIEVKVPVSPAPAEWEILNVPFSFTRLSQIVVSAVDSAGRPQLADFYLNSNDFQQAASASYGYDFIGDSYTFRLKSGSYTVHAVSLFKNPLDFVLSEAVSMLPGAKATVPLSTADARQFKVQAESFSKVPLRFAMWEKALRVYDDDDLFQTTYTAYSPQMPDGNKVVYVSDRPENGLNTDVIIDYEGYPTTAPK